MVMDRLGRGLRSRMEAQKERKRLKREGPQDPHTLFYRAHTERMRVLEDARRALADLAVHERRADLLAAQARESATKMQEEAAAAVRRGEDGRAHDLLDRVVDQERAARQWLARRDELGRQLTDSRRSLERLERQAELARTRQMALLTDTEAAQARRRIVQAGPALEQGLSDLDRKMAEVEALAAARAELDWHDSASEQVVRAFEDLEREQDVRERLQQISHEFERDDARRLGRGEGGPGGAGGSAPAGGPGPAR